MYIFYFDFIVNFFFIVYDGKILTSSAYFHTKTPFRKQLAFFTNNFNVNLVF